MKKNKTTNIPSNLGHLLKLGIIGIFVIVANSCKKPAEPKTFTYSANGNNWADKEIINAVGDEKISTIYIESAGNFQNTDASGASKVAKDVHGYFGISNSVNATKTPAFNFQSVTAGAADTLKKLGYTVTGEIITPIVQRDTTFTYSPIYGLQAGFTLDVLNALEANPEIRYIVIKPIDFGGQESSAMNAVTRALTGLFERSDMFRAGPDPISNITITKVDSAKLFGSNTVAGELNFTYGTGNTVIEPTGKSGGKTGDGNATGTKPLFASNVSRKVMQSNFVASY